MEDLEDELLPIAMDASSASTLPCDRDKELQTVVTRVRTPDSPLPAAAASSHARSTTRRPCRSRVDDARRRRGTGAVPAPAARRATPAPGAPPPHTGDR